ncbi:insulin-induced gene 1 protein isoform X1 [Vicugna pacos]|uniref:Insulin-induced gene protein n=1 Tax=Vicugna pacos TaxID=30538 RepID=A0ABM5DH19_VICPA
MPRLDDHLWSCPCAKGVKHRSHLRAGAGGLETKVGEMTTSSVSGPSLLVAHGAGGTDPAPGPQSSGLGGHSWHHHLLQRSLVLFSVGVVLALVLNLLQVQRNVTLFPEEVIATIFSSAWWVPPCCGTAAAGKSSRKRSGLVAATWKPRHFKLAALTPPLPSRTAVVGLLYPCIDSHLGEPHKFKREWASVMRCVAVFVGINHASAKLDFANNVQLSLTLAALSLGLWWTFDRSRSGLGLGITIAFLATLITQLLVYNGVYQYTSPDFLYIRSWLPCIFFSGGVTVGNIGRQLAMTSTQSLRPIWLFQPCCALVRPQL